MAWTAALVSLIVAGLLAHPAREVSAQPLRPDEVVLADAIAVELIDRQLVAFDLTGTGRLKQTLELDEEVLWLGARGRIALALTTRRVLGATPGAGSWREERFRLTERLPEAAEISQRIGLLYTSHRVVGFSASRSFTTEGLGPGEQVLNLRVGPGTAVVITNRRALGLSADAGGFFDTRLQIGETIESLRAVSSIATITTSRRTLIFRGPTGRWSEERRSRR